MASQNIRFIWLISSLATCIGIVSLVESAPANSTVYAIDLLPSIDTTKECSEKTGWPAHHVDSSLHYNDGCSVICVIKGQDYSHAIRENEPCFDQQHVCHHGSCYLKSSVPVTSDEVYAVITIHSASIRDADPWPMQGSSDAFAVLEIVGGKNPGIICHTKTIQDDNNPRWNHQCTSNPMNMSSTLRFSVFDSDRPAERPDRLGSATVTLQDLADSKPHRLSLAGSEGGTQNSYIQVSISAQKNPPK